MKAGQRPWTRDELILAINLYCKLPFGKMHARNEEIKSLAVLLGRSPGSVARKLGNFASIDPTLQARGIKGLSNTSKLDVEVWNEFYSNWDDRFVESEKSLARIQGTTIEKKYELLIEPTIVGEDRLRSVKVRLNQSLFRTIVLTNFDNQCCITKIGNPELLVAGHIKQWSEDERNRLNPRNGLCLNALHDRAFEKGLITITGDFRIRISSSLMKRSALKSIKDNFSVFDGKLISMPRKFTPDPEFLKFHNQERFQV